ncbi:LptA/OstA family protein [Sphingomonas sp. DBB INV C78]|uniref:LptA/OstA family protein n=1 Tax=Sphingomonas sp. DBB INV C78 TaxID=3349434 RepID=UPI0036D40D01
MTRGPALLLSTLLILSAGPALSQGSVSALKGHNSNAPVDVEADRIEVQDRADRAIFSGNVQVRQADMTMNAARLTVAYSGGASGTQIQRLDASGGVTVRSPSETARGSVAIYDLDRRLITMLGNVTLTQGQNTVNGGRLVIDLNSGRSTIDGKGVGATGQGGRVTGRFTVKQSGN